MRNPNQFLSYFWIMLICFLFQELEGAAESEKNTLTKDRDSLREELEKTREELNNRLKNSENEVSPKSIKFSLTFVNILGILHKNSHWTHFDSQIVKKKKKSFENKINPN